MKEAEKNHVLPIDDRTMERIIAGNVGRPDIMGDRKSLTLAEGMVGMSENVFINIKNRPITLTADVEIPTGTTANGILIAQGGRFGGWALYVKDGVVAYDYNFLGMQRFTVSSSQNLHRANTLLSLILLTMEVVLVKAVWVHFILMAKK